MGLKLGLRKQWLLNFSLISAAALELAENNSCSCLGAEVHLQPTESKITLSNELLVQEMEKPPSPFLLWESPPYAGGIFKDKSASLTFHCAWNEFSRADNTTLSLKSLLLVCWVPKGPGRKKGILEELSCFHFERRHESLCGCFFFFP